jgi:uncharacterized protein YjaG (DUF416 family)
MLIFDRESVTKQIEPLPKRLRVAFAAACAQRQLPSYVRTSAVNSMGNPEAVTRILRELWESVEHNAFDVEKLRSDLALCDALTPSHDTPSFPGSGFAQRALLSLAYAFDTALDGSSQDTMWAAECAYNAVFAFIVQRFGGDSSTPRGRLQIISFPVMQAELSRQQADLAELLTAAKHLDREAAVITRVKCPAKRDAASFFG